MYYLEFANERVIRGVLLMPARNKTVLDTIQGRC